MTAKKNTFQGKDIAEAISNACKRLKVPQEQLDIEVVNTGSAGIFGLCRQKAAIKVTLKQETAPAAAGDTLPPAAKKKRPPKKKPTARVAKPKPEKENAAPVAREAAAPPPPARVEKKLPAAPDLKILTDEEREAVKADINQLLELMGFPSVVTVSQDGDSLLGHIDGDHVKDIIGEEGRTLDSLQYLLRKMFSKKFSFKIILNLDAGDFRANRLQNLTDLSLKYAAEVKESGKTRAIPSLNPSERRVVHMALQNDKDIRSRSVGEGLFKKVLIYRPGKGKKNSRKRRGNKPTPK
jgi:spoIIIJ-associated protein